MRRLLAPLALALIAAALVPGTASAATPQVRVALEYACALTEAGNVYCWGRNFRGQLGNGTRTDSAVPVQVVNVANAVQIDAGMYGACALIADGTVKCWGSNEYGALGTGGGPSTNILPTTVAGISGALKVSTGEATICALLASPAGTVKCWGYGSAGQLGIASPPSSTATPQTITTLGGPATDIAVAEFHACAVVGGALKCWGSNYSNQISTASTSTQYDTPVPVAGLASGVAVPAPGNNHTCAIMTTGAIKCWGANTLGQDGSGVTGNTTTPQNNLITSGANYIGYGDNFNCALVGDSGRCWGSNYTGELGAASDENYSAVPLTPVGLGAGVTSIDAGGLNACAIVSKVLKCWGFVGGGAIGNGLTADHNSPVDVAGISTATDVDISTGHACAVLAATTVSCWGNGATGQLGTGNTQSTATPVPATGFGSGSSAVSAIASTTCVVDSGAVRCVGSGANGELGNNASSSSSSVVNATQLTSGTGRIDGQGDTFCAVQGGQVWCWGDNDDSKLGQGSGQDSATLDELDEPTEVVGIASGATSVAVGYRHACAVVSAALRCWGRNSEGEVSGGTTTGEYPAVQTPGVTSVSTTSRAVAVSYGTTCAVVTSPSGGVQCFGVGRQGQLGNGSLLDSNSEVNVSGISGATAVAGSDGSFCALVSGAVKCWGNNDHGELGNGTNADSSTPVTVLGISNATSISGGGSSFCAELSTGGVKCWGEGGAGQLGVGAVLEYGSPVDVAGLSVFNPLPNPYVKQKIKATLKQNGKAKVKRGRLNVPLKLYFKIPAGANAATVCTGNSTISVKTSKKKTTKLKVKFKRKSPNCSYTGTIKLPKSFKGKKKKFTVSIPENADVLKYKSTKTLKLK